MKSLRLIGIGVVVFLFLSYVFCVFPLSALAEFPSAADSNTLGTNGTVNAIITDSNGVTYIGGTFTNVGTNALFNIILNPTSGEVQPMPVTMSGVQASVADGNGGVYLGGTFSGVSVNSNYKFLVHIKSDGTLDTTFNPQVNNWIFGLALYGNTLYASGDFTSVNGSVTRNHLASFDATTGTVTSFDPNVNGRVYSVAVSSDGNTLYAGGNFTQVNGTTTRNNLAAFDVTQATTNVTSFDPNIGASLQTILLNGTTLYASGGFTTVNGTVTRNRLAAFDTTQATNNVMSFDPNLNDIANVLIINGTTLYAGGWFTTVNGSTTRKHIAAFDVTQATTNVTSFDPNVNSTVNTMLLTSGTLYAGGSFTTVNGGASRNYFAAFDTTQATSNVTSLNPKLNNTISSITQTGSNLYLTGSFSLYNISTRNNLAAFNKDGSLSSFDPNIASTVNALALRANTLYVGGSFTTVNSNVTRSRLAAFDTTQPTNNVTSFNPNISSTVNSLLLDGTTLYVGGAFTTVNTSVTRNRLASFDTTQDTTNVTSFNPNVASTVSALALKGSILYAGGSFTTVNGTTSRSRLAAFDTTLATNNATAFNPTIGGTVNALVLNGTTLYVGGTFSTVNSTVTRNRVASFDTTLNTNNVTSFDPNLGTGGAVNALVINGTTLYAGGAFTTVNGSTTRNRLASFDTTVATNNTTAFNPNMSSTVSALAIANSTLYAGGSFGTVGGVAHSNYATFTTATVPSGPSGPSYSPPGQPVPHPEACENPAPAGPDLFKIVRNTDEATLYFTPVNPMTYYYVSYSENPDAELYGAEFGGTTDGVQSLTIHALNPSRSYYFKVRGGNGCMPGAWSQIQKVNKDSTRFISPISESTEPSSSEDMVTPSVQPKSTNQPTSVPTQSTTKQKHCILFNLVCF